MRIDEFSAYVKQARQRSRLSWLPLCLLGMLLFALSPHAAAQPPKLPPPKVVVSRATQADVDLTVEFVGTVMPTRTSVVGAAVAGRVQQYPLNEGDRVSKGDVICQLRATPQELMKAAAEARQEALYQELLQLQKGSRDQEIAESKARMQSAEALYKYTQANLARIQRAEASGAFTADELGDAVMRNTQAERLAAAARAAYELVEAGPREEEIARAQAEHAAQKAEVARLQDEIERHTIAAPFDGYITAEHTEVGAWVQQGDSISTVVELDEVDVEVVVLERYIFDVQLNDAVKVTIGGLDRAFDGRVVAVVPQADVQSRSFPVKIRVKNEIGPDGPLLKPGMFAKAKLPVGGHAAQTLVHKDALVLGGRTPIVYVVSTASDGKSSTARPVPVTPGVESGGMIQVSGEVKPGDLVVIRGNERLQQGGAVEVTETR